MSDMLPPARPEFPRPAAEKLLHAYGVTGPALLGRRGYYRDALGTPGKNDRGIYDDAIMLVTPNVYATFNANTDPSVTRPGIAVLDLGVWDYKLGIHNISKDPRVHPHYPALIQAGPVRVVRDGGHVDTGWFGINIHRGGLHTTSSEGCQTIHPSQWQEFIDTVTREMHALHLTIIPYVLTIREDA